MGSNGVAGRSATPARAPSRRISRASRTGACAASRWKVTFRAPASAYAGAHRSGCSIMRWVSIGTGLALTSDSTTGSPSVRFGTKWLSMTSTCAQSASAIRASSSARRAKSAVRMLGEICRPTARPYRREPSQRAPPARPRRQDHRE